MLHHRNISESYNRITPRLPGFVSYLFELDTSGRTSKLDPGAPNDASATLGSVINLTTFPHTGVIPIHLEGASRSAHVSWQCVYCGLGSHEPGPNEECMVVSIPVMENVVAPEGTDAESEIQHRFAKV